MRMKNYWIGLFALLTLGFFGITAAQAGDWTTYKPGVVKAAVASGEPALLFYRTTWWGTCVRQGRVLKKLRESFPAYNEKITFILIDWDINKDKRVTTSRRIPRRSTMVLIKGSREVGRLIGKTDEGSIKAFLNKALAN